MRARRLLALIAGAVWTMCAHAEPFLAVETGYQCKQCHVNPTGGGLRNTFGALFSQNQLPAHSSSLEVWTGTVLERFAIGGDGRGSGRLFDVDGQDNSRSFEVDRATLYLNVTLNEHVSAYLDEQVAPGGSSNRQAWAMFSTGDWYLKAGKLVLPFGTRLEDDAAFIREITGINFDSADNGIEAGYAGNVWSAQLSVTNGTAGASEVDDGKQGSLRIERVQAKWRAGASANFNHTDPGDRTMYGVFGGRQTGPVGWLVEYDRIEDDGFGAGNRQQDVALLEAAIRLRKGHYLRLTAEANLIDDGGTENRYRYGAVYQYFPWAFTEFSAGYRKRDSDASVAALNASEAFLEAHVFF
jgi:hypothetical protein